MQSLDDCEAQTKFTTFFSVAGMEDNDLMIRIHERDDVIVGCYAMQQAGVRPFSLRFQKDKKPL